MPVSSTSNGKDSIRMNGEEESSNSEGESSPFDEDESDRRKGDCLDDLQYLEQQFSDLKELLYQERLGVIEYKIETVSEGKAPEYLHSQKDLQRALTQKLDMAEAQLQCKLRNIDNKYEEEVQSAEQDFKDLCELMRQRLIGSVKDRIGHLQGTTRGTTSLVQDGSVRKRKVKGYEFQFLPKRKRPVNVTGPCVVYMLRDADILQDVADITKGSGSDAKWSAAKK